MRSVTSSSSRAATLNNAEKPPVSLRKVAGEARGSWLKACTVRKRRSGSRLAASNGAEEGDWSMSDAFVDVMANG